VPLVCGQVARGGPVTITDPEMTRYLMPISDAVRLCFAAVERMEGGEVFILKMPRVRTGDLIEVLVEAYAPQFGFRADQVGVETIGARAGEKRDEVLMTGEEALAAVELEDMYVVNPQRAQRRAEPVHGGQADEPLLDRAQIRDLLDAAGWLRPESLPALG
jgi:FlaA1/EpsC-like NDP-sugar epimerase